MSPGEVVEVTFSLNLKKRKKDQLFAGELRWGGKKGEGAFRLSK